MMKEKSQNRVDEHKRNVPQAAFIWTKCASDDEFSLFSKLCNL